jgi:hypothetical protein|tara:strand:- start:3379 stop:3771 length:393 start_codon:yes stop_codon:yes gene_type:complete
MKKFLIITITILIVMTQNISAENIPNLIGMWTGENDTYSELKGLKTWEKNVEITEQTDRRFKGHFTYSDGTKNFYGIIHPDNVTITWVASNSRGYNIGKILESNKISACYVESGIDATVGCAVLSRVKNN